MKKILRLDFIATTIILCASFLLCGIAEINDKTTFVSSGQQSEVFRSQKQDGDAMFSLEKQSDEKSDSSTLLSVDLSTVGKVAGTVKYCCMPPLGCIISFVEENMKKQKKFSTFSY